jgi:hypothetical protein
MLVPLRCRISAAHELLQAQQIGCACKSLQSAAAACVLRLCLHLVLARTCARLPTGAVGTAAQQSGDSPTSVVTVLIGQAAVQDAGLTVFCWQLQRLIQGLREWVAMCERQVLQCNSTGYAVNAARALRH